MFQENHQPGMLSNGGPTNQDNPRATPPRLAVLLRILRTPFEARLLAAAHPGQQGVPCDVGVGMGLPPGKHTKKHKKNYKKNCGTSPFMMGKLTISMAMFHSYVLIYQRVVVF